jgi:peptidoglycan/LPS O-acetylase OafA/YrhL
MAEEHRPTAVAATPGPAPQVDQAGERRSARIESLRALAALGVLIAHAYGWSHGWQNVYDTVHGRVLMSGGFGVFLFFALSGYLLFLPFARASFGGGGRIELGRYALNRALRVLPLYYVVIATFLVVRGEGLQGEWWRFALFLESFSERTVATVDGPVWSLVVEVQFYVLLPLFAWLVSRASRRSLAAASVLVSAMGIAALAVRLVTVTHADSVTQVWRYSLPATCVFFFPGLLLALLRVHLDNRGTDWRPRRLLGSSTLWLLAGAALWLVVAYRFSYDVLLLPASALLLGACAMPLRVERALRVLDLRWLAGLGAASYSLYLWHNPIVQALSEAGWMPDGFGALVLVSLVVCSAVAVASYRMVETPFLRLRRAWSPARVPVQITEPYADGIIDAVPVERTP